MLVTKSKTGTWLALAICFGTLTAYGFLLITLELPLTASQAVNALVDSRGAAVDKGRHAPTSPRSHAFGTMAMKPLCSRMAISCRVHDRPVKWEVKREGIFNLG